MNNSRVDKWLTILKSQVDKYNGGTRNVGIASVVLFFRRVSFAYANKRLGRKSTHTLSDNRLSDAVDYMQKVVNLGKPKEYCAGVSWAIAIIKLYMEA